MTTDLASKSTMSKPSDPLIRGLIGNRKRGELNDLAEPGQVITRSHITGIIGKGTEVTEPKPIAKLSGDRASKDSRYLGFEIVKQCCIST